jgi:hypothetical protein
MHAIGNKQGHLLQKNGAWKSIMAGTNNVEWFPHYLPAAQIAVGMDAQVISAVEILKAVVDTVNNIKGEHADEGHIPERSCCTEHAYEEDYDED